MLGVILAAVLSGHSSAVAAAGLGLAVSESVSMGGAALLAKHGTRKIAIMSGSVFLSILLPVLPFLFLSGTSAFWLSMSVAGLVLFGIAQSNSGSGWFKSYSQTFGIVSVAVALTVILGFVLK